jgi:cytidyltransferase-like protein
MIIKNIYELRKKLESYQYVRPIYMTSGGFDPIHPGHVRCITHTASLATNPHRHAYYDIGTVVVVVNSDNFLINKKGFAFMSLDERMEIIDAISGVDYVTSWDNTKDDTTVCKPIEILKPKYFTKGGDRFDASTIPEWEICQKIGCEILTGIGAGGKIQSSSNLIKNALKQMFNKNGGKNEIK